MTHVTRGEEWICSTPIHLPLYRRLRLAAAQFAHFPLLRNPDRSKISKRKNPAARLLWFIEQGFLPEALLNYLALMGWSMPDEREIFSYQEMVEQFTWSRFSTGGPVFDVAKLDWMNNQYLQRLSDDEFLERVRPFLPDLGRDAGVRIMAPRLKERIHRLIQVREQVDFLFADDLDLDADLLASKVTRPLRPVGACLAAERVLRVVEPYD